MARLLGCRIGEVQKVPLFCGDNGSVSLILVHRRIDELIDVRLGFDAVFCLEFFVSLRRLLLHSVADLLARSMTRRW